MLEIEREPGTGVERADDQLDHSVVARGLQLPTHRAQSAPEPADAFRELLQDSRPIARQLRREAKAVGRLLGPPAELFRPRNAVTGGVQLHGLEALRVEGEELLPIRACGIEARLPGGLRPA